MPEEPLDPPRAKQRIRDILANGSVSFSNHALEEMDKDKLTAVDVTNVLRGGVVDPAEFENGSWLPGPHGSDRRHRRLAIGHRAAGRDCVEDWIMNCPDCNQPMPSAHENYGYAASGLPYVTLVGVEVRRCAACGEHEVVVPKIEQLHRTIAMAVVEKRSRLTAAEIRFLRKYLGWSGVDFARHMGVTPESVSRWENDREQMAAVADRLLRLMVVTQAPVSDYSLDALVDLDEKSAPVRLRVAPKKGGWLAEVQAA